jgi:hypothetical protein
MNFGINVLSEPKLISEIQTDYLAYIRKYKNLVRPSIFVRYYNINTLASTVDPILLATHEDYLVSDIKFDIYDYCPLLFNQQVLNKSLDDINTRGLTFDGSWTANTYSIKEPKLGDLISFYSPLNKSDDIFKVISLTLNSQLYENDLPYFELEMEYAPITKDIRLKINKYYVYNMALEKNLERDTYNQYVDQVEKIENIILEISKYHNKIKDIFEYDQKAPLVTNELIIRLKKNYNSGYMRLFEQIKYPYNYNIIVGTDTYLDYNSMPFKENINNKFKYYNLKNNRIEDYIWFQDEEPKNDFENLLSLSKKLYNEMILFNVIEQII